MRPPVTVIIPIFKVERFIERNAHQLFQQDLQGIEYIFVDDCSPDNSLQLLEAILNQYPDKVAMTTIISHPVNKGLPSARNSGLAIAKGEFIFHCDSDDWLEADALSQLYHKACADSADVVWCDWYLSFRDNERYMRQTPQQQQVFAGIDIVKLMLNGRVRYNVWNKLVKRSLYEQGSIHFPDGYGMGEDMTMIRLLALAARVSYLPKALYHYIQLNTEAFTQKANPQYLVQLQYNVDQTILFLKGHYGTSILEDIQFFKLNVKLPFLISEDSQSYQRWQEWYPESNNHIGLNPAFSWRIRLIQYAAIHKQYWILRLYYHLVVRMMYGLIYK